MKKNWLSRVISTPIKAIKDNVDPIVIGFLLAITIAQAGKYINVVADHKILGYLQAAAIDLGIYRISYFLKRFQHGRDRILAILFLIILLGSSFAMNFFYLDKSFITSKADYLTITEKLIYAATLPLLIGILSYFSSMTESHYREQRNTRGKQKRIPDKGVTIENTSKNQNKIERDDAVDQIVNPSPFSGMRVQKIT